MVEILLFCFADEQNLHAADAPLSLLNVLAVIKHFGRLLYVPKDQMEFECCDKDLTGPVTSLFILREWEPTFYKVGLGCDILSSIFGLLLFASLLGSETSLKELKVMHTTLLATTI